MLLPPSVRTDQDGPRSIPFRDALHPISGPGPTPAPRAVVSPARHLTSAPGLDSARPLPRVSAAPPRPLLPRDRRLVSARSRPASRQDDVRSAFRHAAGHGRDPGYRRQGSGCVGRMGSWGPGASAGIPAGTEALRPSASRPEPGWTQVEAPPCLRSSLVRRCPLD